ncbi:DUF6624 domain-containing protein [Streptomyces sp. NPDC059853]|uniref:DUF6624 domain-containing protein n=1 Tax=Streptomyces sp. NPDC059853 TaxID=3346973 RepID=UPI00365F8F00
MTHTTEELAAELSAMAEEDHRTAPLGLSEDPAERLRWHRLTARHADRLNAIMDEYGWPTADRFGADAAHAAWLIAQHADRRLDVQRRAVRLLEAAVADGRASARDLAFLRDRTLVNEGREQLFGTQIGGVRDGAPVPWPIEDPAGLDARRAAAGIEPFAAYTARHAPAAEPRS